MLTFIKDQTNLILNFIKDDPVRPEIPKDFRVSNGRLVAALVEEDKPDAIVCVSFHNFIPAKVEDLTIVHSIPDTAVFYTIWSYKAGKGQELLRETVYGIKKEYPHIHRFVTLSPKTEMARKFHLKNGAMILRENTETINYEYVQIS